MYVINKNQQMKSIQIKNIEALNSVTSIKEAIALLSNNCTYEAIDVLNWASSFGHKPETKFAIACSDDSFFLHFLVVEESVKALFANDQESVWEDSCVEFFCMLPEQPFYYNFEFNCIGTCVATAREGREKNVRPFDADQLAQIERYASLGNQPFGEKHEKTAWEICVKIPFVLLGLDKKKLPKKLRANFYKCGDKTAIPHFVSWNPIQAKNPDFHLPEFFGEIYF